MIFRKPSLKKAYSPGRIIWQRYYSNSTGMIALLFIVLSFVIALAGYLVTPDKTPFANRQILEISIQKPGFSTEVLRVRNNEPDASTNLFHTMLFGKREPFTYYPMAAYRFQNDSIYIELFDPEPSNIPLILSFHLAEVIFPLRTMLDAEPGWLHAKLIDGSDVSLSHAEARQILINENIVKQRFWLGTDQFGRDMLSRILIGTRISLSVGFISVFISLIIGLSIGSIGGYFRGRVDDFVVWLINVVWSIPTLLMVIAITFALGKGFWQVFVAVGLTMWVEVARVVRGQIISVREKEFVEAGKALGFSHFRIIARHILPNIISPVIVISAANFASAILIEAGLSFLGLGVQPPVPSWGTMIKENYAFIILDLPYLAILPGMAIMLMVLAFMLVGNALRDAQDVKL
jgi:peptide/nickel transport system permease protein